MADLNFQDLSTVQNSAQQKPVTLASATTIAPTTFLTIVTGTVQVATITPPATGTHMLAIVHSDNSPGTYLTTGNVTNAVVPTQNVPCIFIYNPATALYYGYANNLT